MAEEATEIKGSIKHELTLSQRWVRNTYRPDLKEEEEKEEWKGGPGEPLFHQLEPHFFPTLESLKLKPEDEERHPRKVDVGSLLSTQLDEGAKTLPQHILVVGRPGSGKTALFANLVHLWLNDKKMVRGMIRYDALIAIQCLGIQPPEDTTGKTNISLLEETLKRLPESCGKYGKDKVRQTLSEMEILFLLDSLDQLPGEYTIDETSFSDFKNFCVIMFSDLKFMKENAHSMRYECDENHLVLRLWGGLAENPTMPPKGVPEPIADFSGGLSGSLFDNYCKRLCEVHGKNFEQFRSHVKELMVRLPLEVRKPFITYAVFKAWSVSSSLKAKTVSEIYKEWFAHWCRIYKTKIHSLNLDAEIVIKNATEDIAELAYENFKRHERKIRIRRDELENFEEKEAFFAHVLVPNHTSADQVLTFTFKNAAQQVYFAAQHIKKQLEQGIDFEKLIPSDDIVWWKPMLPMVLGLTRDLQEKTCKYAIRLVEHGNSFDTITKFEDPIVNYIVQVLGETTLYTLIDGKYNQFVRDLLNTLEKDNSNWYIVDGNMVPEALSALCECGHSISEGREGSQMNEGEGIPQRLSFQISGLLQHTPALCKLIEAIVRCNIRVSLLLESTLSGVDEEPVDELVRALHTKGRASLGKLSGCMKDISLLDSHPATRRIYGLGLRLREHRQYEELQKLCKRSNKLTRIAMRFPNVSEMKVKKMKEMPACISHLSVYLEGVNDESLGEAIAAWRAIRGTIGRKDKEYLRFWASEGKHLTVSGAIQVIEANLPARQIEVPLEQPLSEFDEQRIQEKLDAGKTKGITIKLLGSRMHPRKDLKPS